MGHVSHLPHGAEVVDVRDPHARLVSMSIVLATLAAAVVGYLLAGAARNAETARAQAQQLGVRAMSSALSSQQTSQADFQTYVLAQEQQREAANARQEGLLAPAAERQPLDLERERWMELARRTEQLTPIRTDGPTGPERDPQFPSRFFTQNIFDSVRQQALQDSANSYAGAWESRTASYTAILTLFAVALYLAGFSLTFPQRIKRVLSTVGLSLLIIGVVWAAGVFAVSPKKPPDRAADEYARGHVALLNAAGPADYRSAIQHFGKAIALRPDYARAYLERGYAQFLAGSPDLGAYKWISNPGSLDASVRDLQAAYDSGLQDFLGLWDLGAGQIIAGIERGDRGLVDSGIDFTRAALKDKPSEPVLHANLAVALLATGDDEGAQSELHLAAVNILYADMAKKTPRLSGVQEAELAGALTGLDQLAAHRKDLAGRAKAAKEFLVGSVSRGDGNLGAGPTSAKIEALRPDVFPGALQVSEIQVSGYQAGRDDVSIQWYQRYGKLGWSVLPEASGWSNNLLRQASDGTYFVLSDYLSASVPPRCLGEAGYRAELYVDGHLVHTSTVNANFNQVNPLGEKTEPLVAAVAGDLNVAYCRPASWRHLRNRVPGLLDGYVSPDGSRGVYLFRVDYPDSYNQFVPGTRATQIADIIMSNPEYQKLFPDTPSPEGSIQPRQFMGIDGGRLRTYLYGGLLGGEVETHAVDTGGAVIVAAVFGPHPYILLQSNKGSLIDSMTLFRR